MSNVSNISALSDMLALKPGAAIEQSLGALLKTIRTHLGLDFAFVSEFAGGQRIFRHIDTDLEASPVKVGGSDPLEESFCQRVVDGRLPQLMRNARLDPNATLLTATHDLPIGAHISVPIVMKDGHVYGTLCGFSHGEDQSLNERDLSMMQAFAAIAAQQLDVHVQNINDYKVKTTRIRQAIDQDEISIVYQPIYQLHTMEIVGFEALSRFSASPQRTPDVWFDEAGEVGMGVELEATAVQKALLALPLIPEHLYLSVNLSPDAIISGALASIFNLTNMERVVLEVTEHTAVKHYGELGEILSELREKGLWVAVDDAGAGYASFKHILKLRPELIKLDISITSGIHLDVARRALTAAFHGFSQELKTRIVAEGIENSQELEALKDLGIEFGQGYFLGRPVPLDQAIKQSVDRYMRS